MVDRRELESRDRELESRVERLRGSRRYDEALREAAMAIELTATGHGDAMMRCGVAWFSARCVVEILGLTDLVDEPLSLSVRFPVC